MYTGLYDSYDYLETESKLFSGYGREGIQIVRTGQVGSIRDCNLIPSKIEVLDIKTNLNAMKSLWKKITAANNDEEEMNEPVDMVSAYGYFYGNKNKLIGMILFAVSERKQNIDIFIFGIHPKYQHQGIGTSFLKYFMNIFHNDGYYDEFKFRLQLPDTVSEYVKQFYLNCGFEVSGNLLIRNVILSTL